MTCWYSECTPFSSKSFEISIDKIGLFSNFVRSSLIDWLLVSEGVLPKGVLGIGFIGDSCWMGDALGFSLVASTIIWTIGSQMIAFGDSSTTTSICLVESYIHIKKEFN